MDTTEDTRDREISLLKARVKSATDERDELRRTALGLQKKLNDLQEEFEQHKELLIAARDALDAAEEAGLASATLA